jgi:class 3 adenylate cyclase
MTGIEPTPLPPGMLERLDMSKSVGFMNEAILAQEHGKRSELIAERDDCRQVVIEQFDEQGFTRLALEVEPGKLRTVCRVHWTCFMPGADKADGKFVKRA